MLLLDAEDKVDETMETMQIMTNVVVEKIRVSFP